MDEKGIRNTLSLRPFLAFIFVIPLSAIPYSAIRQIKREGALLTAVLDKSKLPLPSLFRPLISNEYHFFFSYTDAKQEDILLTLYANGLISEADTK